MLNTECRDLIENYVQTGGTPLVMVASCRPGPDISAIADIPERQARTAAYNAAWNAWMAGRLAAWRGCGLEANHMASVVVLTGNQNAWSRVLPVIEEDEQVQLEPNRLAYTISA